MKKWLVLILAIIVTAGSAFPCCPDDGCCKDLANSSSNESSSSEIPFKTGVCSPFFACAGCAGFVQMFKVVHVMHPAVQRAAHHQKIITSFSSTYYSSFFQPPRIS